MVQVRTGRPYKEHLTNNLNQENVVNNSDICQAALITALQNLILRGDRIEACHLDEIARQIGVRDACKIAEKFAPNVQALACVGFAIEAADQATRRSGNEAIAEASKAKALGQIVKQRLDTVGQS